LGIDKKEIGKRVAQVRKRLGLSQEKAALQLDGISRTTLANIESGAQNVTVEFLIQFSKLSLLSIDTLLGLHLDNSDSNSKDFTDALAKCKDLESTQKFAKELIAEIDILQSDAATSRQKTLEAERKIADIMKNLQI